MSSRDDRTAPVRRRLAGMSTLLIGIMSFGGVAAGASTPIAQSVETATVANAGISIEYPNTWTGFTADPRQRLEAWRNAKRQHPRPRGGIRLRDINTQFDRYGVDFRAMELAGRGEVTVNRAQTLRERWWNGLNEWGEANYYSVEMSTGAYGLRIAELSIGGRPAFLWIGSLAIGKATAVVIGSMEILLSDGVVAQVGVVVNARTPALAETILRSVQLL